MGPLHPELEAEEVAEDRDGGGGPDLQLDGAHHDLGVGVPVGAGPQAHGRGARELADALAEQPLAEGGAEGGGEVQVDLEQVT